MMVPSYRKEEGTVEVEFLVVVCELHEETCALCSKTADVRVGAFRVGMLNFWREM